jgi:hypothetical protein
MVLTIDVPKLENVAAADMPRAVLDQWPELFSYAISSWSLACSGWNTTACSGISGGTMPN